MQPAYSNPFDKNYFRGSGYNVFLTIVQGMELSALDIHELTVSHDNFVAPDVTAEEKCAWADSSGENGYDGGHRHSTWT